MTAPNLLAWAQSYAERGWAVVPLWGVSEVGGALLCRCRAGAACDHPSKHPAGRLVPHGLSEASTDVAQVTAWWERDPTCNIGVTTGVVFDTLDVDHDEFAAGVADLPDCDTDGGPTVLTGSGRYHLLFTATGLPRRIRFSQHCDWLGSGGYQVMPPSRSVRGTEYRWWSSPDLPLTRPPRPLLDVLDPPVRYSTPLRPTSPAVTRNGWSPAGLFTKMAGAVEGERNSVLHWCAARIGEDVGAGKADESAAFAALEQLADVARRAGLGDREVAATIRSGYRP